MTPPAAAFVDSVAPDEGAHLATLLTKQRDLYQELAGLSARQQVLIDESRTEELLTVLSQRQALIDQLTACNKEVAPLRSRLGDIAAAAPEDTRQTIRARVDEVQALLEEIIGRDEADRAKLEASRQRVGEEMKRINVAPAAANAYRAQAAGAYGAARPAARFTDSQG